MENGLLCHMSALMIGCLLDFIVGDPHNFPHPVRLIGRLIATLDKAMLKDTGKNNDLLKEEKNVGDVRVRNGKCERRKGLLLVLVVLFLTVFVTGFVMFLAYRINVYLGVALEAILTSYLLAAKSLRLESQKVEIKLKEGDLAGAREAVSMIVGRDTADLDQKAVARAAVETVAENTSDGVIAPLFYTILGGPVLGFFYKAVNTMDSMVGYRNERYENFGFCAAKLDDIMNYLPARVSALCMILAAAVLGNDYNAGNAWKIFKRDRYQHKSPNSAQTESACAGVLGLRLAGDAFYFGKLVKKPYIGDALREIEPEDISRSGRLMYMTEAIFLLLCVGIMGLILPWTL